MRAPAQAPEQAQGRATEPLPWLQAPSLPQQARRLPHQEQPLLLPVRLLQLQALPPWQLPWVLPPVQMQPLPAKPRLPPSEPPQPQLQVKQPQQRGLAPRSGKQPPRWVRMPRRQLPEHQPARLQCQRRRWWPLPGRHQMPLSSMWSSRWWRPPRWRPWMQPSQTLLLPLSPPPRWSSHQMLPQSPPPWWQWRWSQLLLCLPLPR